MSKKSIEILVGLFVLLGALALLFLALKAANLASFSNGGETSNRLASTPVTPPARCRPTR